MQGEATEKVPGGKLVRIKVDFDDSVKDIKITGDFFLHPEECIHEIENIMKNVEINFDDNTIIAKIDGVLKENNAELIGINSETLAKTLRKAIENGKMASNTS